MHLRKVKLSITDACEGTCSYCYRGPIVGRSHLPLNAIRNALASVQGSFNQIHISGGNPLLHPEFEEIIEICASHKTPIKLSANPRLLLTRFSKVIDKIDEFGFSIESPNHGTHDAIRGIKGDLESLERFVGKYRNERKITVTIVITNESLDFVEESVRFAKRLSVSKIKIQVIEGSLTPTSYTATDFLASTHVDRLEEIYDRLTHDPEVTLIPVANKYQSVRKMLARLGSAHIGPTEGELAHCGYMLQNPHIKEDGGIYPCCGVANDRLIGNILRDDLASVLTRHYSEHSNHRSLPYTSCKECIFYSHYNFDAPILAKSFDSESQMPKVKVLNLVRGKSARTPI